MLYVKESNVLDSRAGRAMSSEAKLRHINISDCATLIYRWNRHCDNVQGLMCLLSIDVLNASDAMRWM